MNAIQVELGIDKFVTQLSNVSCIGTIGGSLIRRQCHLVEPCTEIRGDGKRRTR